VENISEIKKYGQNDTGGHSKKDRKAREHIQRQITS
jgi:hypothetical protein